MLNHIAIMGRLVRDPELRKTGSGLSVANFSVAVDRDRCGQDGNKETDFIDCVAWRQTADFVSKYFTKGRMIVVSGRLTTSTYTDREGNKRKKAEVVAENCYFGDSKREGDSGSKPSTYGRFEESMAQVSKYSGVNQDFNYPYPNQPTNDYAVLTDDDYQFPF